MRYLVYMSSFFFPAKIIIYIINHYIYLQMFEKKMDSKKKIFVSDEKL